MDHPSCPRCQSVSSYKNGTANGDPKRKCKDCGYQFTRLAMPRFRQADKDRAVALYLEGLSLRAVAKLLSTTATSVLKWVRAAGKAHGQRPEPEPGGAPVIEVDEMWHCVKKSPQAPDLESVLPENREAPGLGVRGPGPKSAEASVEASETVGAGCRLRGPLGGLPGGHPRRVSFAV